MKVGRRGSIITLRDGKIQRDVAVESALDGDLYDLKSSAPGHAILERIIRDFQSQARRPPTEAEIDEWLAERFSDLIQAPTAGKR